MRNFVTLTVAYTKDRTRKELINMSRVFRIIEANNETMVCFNSTGSDHIIVKESREEIEKLIG